MNNVRIFLHNYPIDSLNTLKMWRNDMENRVLICAKSRNVEKVRRST